jgi:hypothetical protein
MGRWQWLLRTTSSEKLRATSSLAILAQFSERGSMNANGFSHDWRDVLGRICWNKENPKSARDSSGSVFVHIARRRACLEPVDSRYWSRISGIHVGIWLIRPTLKLEVCYWEGRAGLSFHPPITGIGLVEFLRDSISDRCLLIRADYRAGYDLGQQLFTARVAWSRPLSGPCRSYPVAPIEFSST